MPQAHVGGLGDRLREAVGGLSPTLNSVVPSAARSEATSDSIARSIDATRSYVADLISEPGRLRDDVADIIDRQWSQLQASHAAAVASGPRTEATWWGETIGRAAFETGAALVPAGAATRIARTADVMPDGRLPGPDPVPTNRIDGRPLTTTLRFTDAESFNRAANAATPNTRYEFGSYAFETDAQGRIAKASGAVDLTPVARNDPDLQRAIGNEGRSTDVGFHLIADRFAGWTNRLNVVPGNGAPIGDGLPNLNNGAYTRLENQIERLAQIPGNRVEIKIEPLYAAGNTSNRPDEFVASYRVNDGRWYTSTFDNK